MAGGSFLIPGSVDHDPAISAQLARKPAQLVAIAKRWFSFARDRGDDVREILHDGHPTLCVRDAAFMYVAIFTKHVNVGFFHGADLPDPSHLLQGAGRTMRHVKIEPDAPVNEPALDALIQAAYRDVLSRLG